MSKIGVKEALKLRPIKENERILDLGSGSKQLLKKTSCSLVLSLDLNYPATIHWDLNKYPYPFEDNSFDAVFCLQTIQYLHNPIRAIREMKRITKRDIVLGIVNPCNPGGVLRNLLHKRGKYELDRYNTFETTTLTWLNIVAICKTITGLKIAKCKGLLLTNTTYLLQKENKEI